MNQSIYRDEELTSRTQLVNVNSDNAILGPTMPKPLSHHCFVKVNDSLAIAVGGYTKFNQPPLMSASTLYLNIERKMWDLGPNLSLPRASHVCGVLKTTEEETSKIVVVAGGDTVSHDLSTEILRLVASNFGTEAWQSGPNIPRKLIDASMVSTSDGKGLILIGGVLYSGYRSKSLLRLECHFIIAGCNWQELPQQLSIPR